MPSTSEERAALDRAELLLRSVFQTRQATCYSVHYYLILTTYERSLCFPCPRVYVDSNPPRSGIAHCWLLYCRMRPSK